MTSLPSGTVTFLFTDIEGSTKLGYTKFARFSAVEQAVAFALEK